MILPPSCMPYHSSDVTRASWRLKPLPSTVWSTVFIPTITKKKKKLCTAVPLWENSQVDFPTQRASNVKSVSISWRHYDIVPSDLAVVLCHRLTACPILPRTIQFYWRVFSPCCPASLPSRLKLCDRTVCIKPSDRPVWHYNDVIMGAMTSQITSRTIVYWSKKRPKLRVTGLCAGNSPVTGEFPAQMASNAENVSIWWRHHGRPASWCTPGVYRTAWPRFPDITYLVAVAPPACFRLPRYSPI